MAEIEDADKVICAMRSSVPVDLEEGKTYYWCTCGRSKKQPFCDGSHQGTAFKPMAYTATATEQRKLCQCKQTANAPFRDGRHKKLPEDAAGKAFPPNSVT